MRRQKTEDRRQKKEGRESCAPFLPAAGRLLPGARRGTVLIFVVALLVLLALMGTAYLATARLNRLASAGMGGAVSPGDAVKPDAGSMLSAFGTVIGSDVDSLKDSLIGSAMVTKILRQAPPAPAPQFPVPALETTYYDYANDTSPSQAGAEYNADFWLGSRVPLASTGDPQAPIWPVISRLANGVNFTTLLNATNLPTGYSYNTVRNYTTFDGVRPTAVEFNYPAGMFPQKFADKTRVYPAFSLDGSNNPNQFVLAGDADGDGIADSGLVDLSATNSGLPGTLPLVPPTIVPAWPNETVGGGHEIHYLAAVRVVDNNSAINANTAWRLGDYAYTNGVPYGTGSNPEANYGFFRSNVGLLDLYRLWTGTPWDTPEGDESNSGLPASYYQPLSQQRQYDKGKFGFELTTAATGSRPVNPVDDSSNPITGYAYTSLAEALEMGVNRRPANSALNGMAGNGRFYSFDQATAASLAFRGGLLNPQMVQPSLLESWLYLDAYWFSPNYASQSYGRFERYPADRADVWFNYNYNYDYDGNGGGSRGAFFGNMSAVSDAQGIGLGYTNSSIATPGNPLSGLPPLPTRPLLTTYNPTNNIIRQPARKTGGNDVLNTGDASATPPTEGMATYAIPAGGDVHPTKIDINSAPFGELWRGFWDVMSDPTDRRQPEAELAGSDVFNKGFLSNVTASGADGKTMIMQLRSALAAVNAEQMRVNNTSAFTNGTHNIISHNIQLVDNTGNNLAFATVYGSAPQPFIVHVEASVARATAGGPEDTWTLKVKLFNPYGQAIGPTAFRFVIYDHAGKAFIKPTVTWGSPGNWYDTAIAQNDLSDEIDVSFPYTAAAAGSPATLPNMDLMLIRTRDATGNTTPPAGGQYDESGDNFKDWVPCDRVGLGTISISDPADATNDPTVYDRPADGSWDCAYAAGSFVKPGDSSGTFLPFPIAIQGMTGPHGISNTYPFGQFARAGEIMLVPFVGSYRIEQTAGTATEMIPITYDVTQVGMVEPMIGRFTPPFENTPSSATAADTRNYWGRDLLDVFTARENPANDYLPAFNVPDTTSPVGTPAAVANLPNETAGQINNATGPEHDLGTAGLININTAPAQVLAMLPLTADSDGISHPGTATADNLAVANAIVAYRQANGPFHSLFELNNVPGFVNNNTANNTTPPATAYSQKQGNLSGIAALDTFYKDYATLCRISNLATTRSDTFTVYVLIQAWQIPEAQTDWLPVLIGQERRAYIVDRSQVNLNSRAIQTQTYGFKEIPVPTR